MAGSRLAGWLVDKSQGGSGRPQRPSPELGRLADARRSRLESMIRSEDRAAREAYQRYRTRRRAAHATNSLANLAEAMAIRNEAPVLDPSSPPPFYSAEGDTLAYRSEAVMRHDPRGTLGLRLEPWLEHAVRARFDVIKLDIKQNYLEPILAAVDRVRDRLPQRERKDFERRLKLNVDLDLMRGPLGRIDDVSLVEELFVKAAMTSTERQLRQLRQRFPQATISIGVRASKRAKRYDAHTLGEMARVADEIGGPFTFALRYDMVDPQVVETLKQRRPDAAIDIWNNPEWFHGSPEGEAAEKSARDKLRGWGVDGVIDFGTEVAEKRR